MNRSVTMTSYWHVWLLTGSLLAAFGGAAVGTLVALERERSALVGAAELSYLPKGEYLKVAVLGYRQLAADLIWLKAVQHLGARHQTTEGYLRAYHAVDVLTDLDPKFAYAYQAAGTILGVWAHRPHESVAILKKGMLENPDVWQMPFFLGYEYYYELKNPAIAAQYFRIAAALPGAPEYLPRLAARMTVEAGDPEAALEFLQRLYQQVRDERLREALVQRMKEVVVERDIHFLEEGVRRYRQRYGRLPSRLGDLVTRGIIVQIPEEPLGGAYVLHLPKGTVGSTVLRERLRVHRQ
jgi:tetratricopeptide (TPR) repeat protein